MQTDLAFVCQATQGILIAGQETAPITGVATDSRTLSAGDLFFALAGENFDGHDYLPQAFAKGAAGAVISKSLLLPDQTWGLIKVEDTLQALQDLASSWRDRFDIPLIAVTGSVGKTTTRDIIAGCLSTYYETLRTEANYNNDIGLPLTLLRLEDRHQAAVVELAMRGRGEIQRLARICRPTAAVITNVEPVHMETLGSLDNIAAAKCEILEKVRDFALINGDNLYLQKAAEDYSCPKYTFGYNNICDFQMLQVTVDQQGLQIQVRLIDKPATFNFPVPSRRLALNVLAGVATAYLYGLDNDLIQTGLGQYSPTGNRLNIIRLSQGGILINDTYNANPVSMAAALETGKELSQGERFVAVLGDMFELGDYEQEGHRMVGKQAALLGVDMLITIGERARYIADEAVRCGLPAHQVHYFPDKESSQALLRGQVSQRDTVLFKASRGMQLETLIQAWLDQY